MNRFPGFGQRIKTRLRACGYWKKGRPDVSRFCIERGYRPQYVYAWLKDRIPGDENLRRLAQDLGVSVAWLMLGQESGAAVAEMALPAVAGAPGVAEVRIPSSAPVPSTRGPRPVFPVATPSPAVSQDAQIIDFKRLREVTTELSRLQADLEAIFVAFPDLYLWLDDGGVVLGYRAGSGQELEVLPSETPGRRIDDVVPAGAVPAMEAALRRVVDEEARAVVEYDRPAVGRTFEARLFPLGVEGPHQGSVLVIIRDITEQRRTTTALSERANLLQQIFEETRLAMVVLDRDGRPVTSNRAFREMLGYSEDELRSRTIVDYTHPDDVQESRALWQELIEGRRDHTTRTKRYVTRDGRTLPVRLTASLIRDAGGAPAFAVSLIEPLSA